MTDDTKCEETKEIMKWEWERRNEEKTQNEKRWDNMRREKYKKKNLRKYIWKKRLTEDKR